VLKKSKWCYPKYKQKLHKNMNYSVPKPKKVKEKEAHLSHIRIMIENSTVETV